MLSLIDVYNDVLYAMKPVSTHSSGLKSFVTCENTCWCALVSVSVISRLWPGNYLLGRNCSSPWLSDVADTNGCVAGCCGKLWLSARNPVDSRFLCEVDPVSPSSAHPLWKKQTKQKRFNFSAKSCTTAQLFRSGPCDQNPASALRFSPHLKPKIYGPPQFAFEKQLFRTRCSELRITLSWRTSEQGTPGVTAES